MENKKKENPVEEMRTEIRLLQQSNGHLTEKIDDLNSTVSKLAESLAPLGAYLASHEALDGRVKGIEERIQRRKDETDPIIQWAYKAMGAAAIISLLGSYFVKDLFDKVGGHETRISVLEARK